MFDAQSYIKAYSNSYSAVSQYLTEYPSIKYVIDLHRDAIADGNGGYKKLTVQLGEKTATQMMFVVGTDEAGASHPEWTKNLRVVMGIQNELSKKYPTLMRPVNLRKASFNQQLCPGYFILEVGGCGDSLDEAKNSAIMFAQVFADHIT
jgi:stage II sporulation protein P